MRVLLDTNFLMLPLQLRIDVFGECDRLFEAKCAFLALQASLSELGAMKGKEKMRGRAAAALAAKKGVEIIPGEGRPDKLILGVAVKNAGRDDFAVATQDRKLADKLKSLGAKVVGLRGKSHLELA